MTPDEIKLLEVMDKLEDIRPCGSPQALCDEPSPFVFRNIYLPRVLRRPCWRHLELFKTSGMFTFTDED